MIRSVMYTRSSSQLLSMAAVRLMLLGKEGDHCQGIGKGHRDPSPPCHTGWDTAACSLSPAPSPPGASIPRLGMEGRNSCVFFTGASPRYSTSREAVLGGREPQAEQR